MLVTLPSVAFATITCPNCQVNSCPCIVGVCASGTFSVYSNSGCSGDPVFEYTFVNRNVSWSPIATGTYYVQAYCDDGQSLDRCTLVNVQASQPIGVTCESQSLYSASDCGNSCTSDQTCVATTSNGLSCYTCQANSVTSTPSGGGSGSGGLDTMWIIVAIIIVIAIILFVVYRLFFSKKKAKKATYEELYRKWGARTR